MRGTEHKSKAVQAAGRAGKGPINEVVCGAMMLAYERAGKWEQVSLLPFLLVFDHFIKTYVVHPFLLVFDHVIKTYVCACSQQRIC